MKSVFCYGELLIDMISTDVDTLVNSKGFLKKFGGAPANTAIGLAKLDVPVIFQSKVGDDPFGHFLADELKNNKVDITHLLFSKTDKTTLAFVSLTEKGDRDFYFFSGAHATISKDEVTIPDNIFIFHFGSLTQTNPVTSAATEKLIDKAKKRNITISYDPNLRPSLWTSLDEAKEVISETSRKVNILKLNQEEALWLSDKKNVEEAANVLFTKNLNALFITMGGEGSYYQTKKFKGVVPTIPVVPIDTTGAGDAFNAGYISFLYEHQKNIDDLSEKELFDGIRRSNIIATLTTMKKGAITAFPSKENLKKYL